MIYLILALINFSIVLLWDYFNWPTELANQLAEIFTNGKVKLATLKKPFGCSLCTTIIISMIYLFVFGNISIFNIFFYVFLSILNGYLTLFSILVINTVSMFLEMILINIQKLIDFLQWK